MVRGWCWRAWCRGWCGRQAEGEAAGASKWKDLKLDNEFEKKLLEEVIPPEQVGTTFDDIGALDAVKASLREVGPF